MTKYKVGDIVTIKSEEWYNSNKDDDGFVGGEGAGFVSAMSKYCGKQSRITEVQSNGYYKLEIDKGYWSWSDYMFEEEEVSRLKHKIGNKVRIKSEDGLRHRDLGVCLHEDMYEYAGKIATITDIDEGYDLYHLDLCPRWCWDDTCFEDSLYLPGDRVKIKSLAWYNENKDEDGYIYSKVGTTLNRSIANDICGKTFIIEDVDDDKEYELEDENYVCDDWIEGLAEEEFEIIDITSLHKIKEESTFPSIRPLPGEVVFVSDSYHEDGPREDWTIARFEKARAKGISTEKGIWNYCISYAVFDYDNWEHTKEYIYRGENHELIKVNKDE